MSASIDERIQIFDEVAPIDVDRNGCVVVKVLRRECYASVRALEGEITASFAPTWRPPPALSICMKNMLG